jgi:LCP family protein required for cell wall assembly
VSSRRSGRARWWRAGVVTVQVLATLLSVAVLLGSGYAWATYRSFKNGITRVNVIPQVVTTTDSNGHTTTVPLPNVDGTDQNILIVGNDDRSTATDAELKQLGTTRDGGSLNTDTMMLLHVPADGSTATVISFPRDSYVNIPGYGMNKLNAAYPDGVNDNNGSRAAGGALLVKTIEGLTGLKIDHYMQVDLLGFYRISMAVGPITVCMNGPMGPATSYGEVGNGYDSGFEPDGTFVYSYSGINLHKGNNKIRGLQALAFVRQRHGLPNGDLDRIKRQQYFLSAVFRKLVSGGFLLDLPKLNHLLSAFNRSVTMDQTLDPLKLAEQMQNLTAGNVRFATIPTQGFATEGSVGDVVVVDTAAMPAFIKSVINPPAVKPTTSTTPPTPTTSATSTAPATTTTPTTGASLGTPTVTTAAQAGCIN